MYEQEIAKLDQQIKNAVTELSILCAGQAGIGSKDEIAWCRSLSVMRGITKQIQTLIANREDLKQRQEACKNAPLISSFQFY